jgi:hypothetical protein
MPDFLNAVNATPVEHLAEVFEALATGREVHPKTSEWLVRGIVSAVRRGESIDLALGLAAPGQRSLQRQLQTLCRDHHLLRAIDLIGFSDELSAWQRCTRLAPLIRSFCHSTWPSCKYLDAAPSEWPLWKAEIFHAARTDIKLPMSARQLYELVKAGAYCSPHRRKAMLLAQLL